MTSQQTAATVQALVDALTTVLQLRPSYYVSLGIQANKALADGRALLAQLKAQPDSDSDHSTAHSGQAFTPRSPDLHAAIMNLPCNPVTLAGLASNVERAVYAVGHRDARHAAAELAVACGAAAGETQPNEHESLTVAHQTAQPAADFADPRVQAVYEILCDADMPGKPRHEHWEGWQARRIVDALATVAQPAAVPVAQDEREAWQREQQRCQRENGEFRAWWDANQQDPLHTLIVMNAAHASWQERARRAALGASTLAQPAEPLPDDVLSLLQRARLYTNMRPVQCDPEAFAVFRRELDAAIAKATQEAA